MTRAESLQKQLALPPVSQIGVVVRNVERAADFYSEVFGIGPFAVYDFTPEKHWFMEEPSPLKIRMGKAPWGGVELELIQPLEGKSLHQQFLDQHGEGLQHLGFIIPDYDEMFEKFVNAGFAPVMRAETYVDTYQGHLKACYFDTRRIGGIIFEIIWRSWQKK